MQKIIKADKLIHRTAKVFGKAYLVFADVVEQIGNHSIESKQGFRFYTKKEAVQFIDLYR